MIFNLGSVGTCTWPKNRSFRNGTSRGRGDGYGTSAAVPKKGKFAGDILETQERLGAKGGRPGVTNMERGRLDVPQPYRYGRRYRYGRHPPFLYAKNTKREYKITF